MQDPGSEAIHIYTPQRLSWVAYVLFSVFVVSILDAALPPRLLDLNWQIGLISSVLNFSIFPLIGLGLLHLAADINPADERLHRRSSLFSGLAVWVSLGFLLLVVLQPLVFWHQLTLAEQGQLTPLRRSEQAVTNIRWTLQKSRSTDEIFENLKALKAPPTPPLYSTLPLAELRERMRADLVTAEQQLRVLRRQTQAVIARGRRAFVAMVLRNSVLALVFALGFAALAQRRRSLMPLLTEWQEALGQLIGWIRPRRRSAGNSVTARMASYIDEISPNDESRHDSTER